jgi:chromate transport protein ChrA
MTFISIHSVIIYAVFLAHVWDAPGFVSLKPGVTEVVSEEMLTVGRNLYRNGQNPYLLILFWFILYLPYSDSFYTYLILILSHLLLFYSDHSYLFYSKTRRISHLGIPTPMTFLRVREPKTKVKTIFFKKNVGWLCWWSMSDLLLWLIEIV